MSSEELGDELGRLVGPAHVEELSSGSSPALAVAPASIDETSRVVALAYERGRTIEPRGGGSRLAPRPSRPRADIVLDLRRLDRLVEHRASDLVVATECGRTLVALAFELARRGQRLPLDPPAQPESTVGGLRATNACGPLRLRYGTARDRVIGTTVVRFDGRVVRAGGMVVKNVSGYDLSKLYIGSYGSLGILVRASLKLEPLPPARGAVVAPAVDREAAFATVAGLLERPLPLVAALYGGPVDDARQRTLQLGLEGPAELLASSGPATAAAAETLGAREAHFVADETVPVSSALDAGEAVRTAPALIRVHARPARYGPLLRRMTEVVSGQEVTEYSLIGCGIGWLAWPTPPDDQSFARTVIALRHLAGRAGGSVVVERQGGSYEGRVEPWQVPAAERALMERIEKGLDPRGTFGSSAITGCL